MVNDKKITCMICERSFILNSDTTASKTICDKENTCTYILVINSEHLKAIYVVQFIIVDIALITSI